MLIDEEGPGILSWCIEGARLDYADENARIFDELKAPLRAAAQNYAQESNPIRDWVDAQMMVSPEKDIDLCRVGQLHRIHCRGRWESRAEPLIGFRVALKAAFPRFTFAKRTTRPHPERAYIRGYWV